MLDKNVYWAKKIRLSLHFIISYRILYIYFHTCSVCSRRSLLLKISFTSLDFLLFVFIFNLSLFVALIVEQTLFKLQLRVKSLEQQVSKYNKEAKEYDKKADKVRFLISLWGIYPPRPSRRTIWTRLDWCWRYACLLVMLMLFN